MSSRARQEYREARKSEKKAKRTKRRKRRQSAKKSAGNFLLGALVVGLVAVLAPEFLGNRK